jgi:hypothetical protein
MQEQVGARETRNAVKPRHRRLLYFKAMEESRSSLLRQILFGFSVLVLVSITAIGTASLKARTFDGPTQLFAGGPLISGPLIVEPEPDWRFTDEIDSIELQLLDPPTSRRVWVIQYGGRIFVVSGDRDTVLGRFWFTWPIQAAEDGRAFVRIDGKRYPRYLRRVQSGEDLEGILAAMQQKYGVSGNRREVEDGVFWLFELAPRIENTE